MTGERFDPENALAQVPKYGRTMRPVGQESHATNPRISVHTYQCLCGETSVVDIGHG